MKCPNCNQGIQDDAKFCTVCGANIEEALKTKAREEEERLEKEAKRKKEIEDKKRLEELRKQEQERQEQLIKEAEKAEAIRQAKEEGIELEIIDEKSEEPEKEVEEEPKEDKSEFKIKNENEKSSKKEKNRKVRIKKNFFQVLIEKLLFIIIVAAIILGAIYFCYRNNYLPDFAMEKAEEIDLTIQNIINLQKDIDEIDSGKKPSNRSDNSSIEWQVENNIEADDIKDLNDDYSIIIKKNLYGLIDNKEGKIVLEPKYSLIEYTNYKTAETTSKGIIVKDGEKFYKINDKFELDGEVVKDTETKNSGAYFFDHHGSTVYYNNAEQVCKKANEKSDKRIEICTDISIVTKDGVDAKNGLLPESFTIDFEKSTLGPKGYCNPEKGELLIDCNYKEALDFSEGYAAVKEDDKAGFINEKGEKWKEFSFEETRSVHNKMAFAKENGKWGIVKIK